MGVAGAWAANKQAATSCTMLHCWHLSNEAASAFGLLQFDYSLEVLATFVGNLSAPVLSCNLEVRKEVRALLLAHALAVRGGEAGKYACD